MITKEQMIAIRFSLEAAVARGAGSPVRRDPVPKCRVLADEASTGGFRVVPFVFPDAVDQQSHDALPCCASSG